MVGVSSQTTSATTRYVRPARLPGLLGAAACVGGLFVLDFEGYLIIRYMVSILALIIVVFLIQGRAWWWIAPMLAVAVLWNPVYPFQFEGSGWMAAHIMAGATFLATGLFTKVPERQAP